MSIGNKLGDGLEKVVATTTGAISTMFTSQPRMRESFRPPEIPTPLDEEQVMGGWTGWTGPQQHIG